MKKIFKFRPIDTIEIPEIELEHIQHLVKKDIKQNHNFICEVCGNEYASTYNQKRCDNCLNFSSNYVPSALQVYLLKTRYAKVIYDGPRYDPELDESEEAKIALAKGSYIIFNLNTEKYYFNGRVVVFNNTPNTIFVIKRWDKTVTIISHNKVMENFRDKMFYFNFYYQELLVELFKNGIEYKLNVEEEVLLIDGLTLKEKQEQDRIELLKLNGIPWYKWDKND